MTTAAPVRRHSRIKLIVMIAAGVAAGLVAAILGWWMYAPTIGWAVSSLVYSGWVWASIGRFDADQTAEHAVRDDPSRGTVDLMVIVLSVASLFAVAFVLVHAANEQGTARALLAGLALVSVALSWILLHTLYTLRYARLFYGGVPGGVDFNQKEAPRYTDFAYLAFTLGMTYQVSDTDLTNHEMRATALRHSLLSFLFGTFILATTINLVAGLSS